LSAVSLRALLMIQLDLDKDPCILILKSLFDNIGIDEYVESGGTALSGLIGGIAARLETTLCQQLASGRFVCCSGCHACLSNVLKVRLDDLSLAVISTKSYPRQFLLAA
jgi:hypothetical protein